MNGEDNHIEEKGNDELTKMDSPEFQLHLGHGDVTAFVKQFGYEMTGLMKHNNQRSIFLPRQIHRDCFSFDKKFLFIHKYALPLDFLQ